MNICEDSKRHILKLESRSGLALKGVTIQARIIDSDYRGEVKALVYNSNKIPFTVKKGQRICQGLFLPTVTVVFSAQDALSGTVRNLAGFGSTGN